MITVLVGAETVLLALLALFVVALLRSHAEILRRLERLGAGGSDLPSPREARADGAPTADLAGSTPSGGVRRIAVGAAGGGDTLLAFLTSGCATCVGLLEQLEHGRPSLPQATRLVVVTKDRELERVRRFRPLEPSVDIVMSSAAWEAYGAPGSPYFVHIDGRSGRIAGEGSAATWEQVVDLLVDALDDHGRDIASRPRIDEALQAAGIGPDDPSLRPGGQTGSGPV